MNPDRLTWLDVEELGERLAELHPDVDPVAVRFTDLRAMVQAIPEFEPEPGHNVNEKILEAIQACWIEARQDV